MPTNERLRRSHIGLAGGYVLCQNQYEDTSHVFVQCPQTRIVLRKLCPKIEQIIEQNNLDQLSIQQTIRKLQEKTSKEEVAHLAALWWCVWVVRNKQIFDPDSESHPLQIEDIFNKQIQN